MTRDEAINNLNNAKAYLRENKDFFKRFRKSYRIISWRFYGLTRGVLFVLMPVLIWVFYLNMDALTGKYSSLGMLVILAFILDVFIYRHLGKARKKYEKMFMDYDVYSKVGKMYQYMLNLNMCFWNRRNINRLIREFTSGSFNKISDAAARIEPNCRELFFDADKFNRISDETYKKVCRDVEEYNRDMELGTQVLMGLVEKSFSGSGSVNTNYTNTYPTSNTNTYVNYNTNDQEAKRKAEREKQLADYARQADWWEQEYNRLKAIDPNHYNTHKAEYNKNYFRRISKGGA